MRASYILSTAPMFLVWFAGPLHPIFTLYATVTFGLCPLSIAIIPGV